MIYQSFIARFSLSDLKARLWLIWYRQVFRHKYRVMSKMERIGRSWRYAIGRMTEDDAITMRIDCYYAGGDFPLQYVTVSGIMQQALERWEDHPNLQSLAEQAAARVWSKWSSGGDYTFEAERWALELMAEYAEADGVRLVEIE